MNKAMAVLTLSLVLPFTKMFSQISPYHGIIFPYESARSSQNIGALINTIPDFGTDLRINPALLKFYKSPQLSIGFHPNWKNYHKGTNPYNNSKAVSQTNIGDVELAGSYPYILSNKKAVLAFSINSVNSPEFEAYEVLEKTRHQFVSYSRKGNVFNSSIGIGVELAERFSLGFSLTKWFGSWNLNNKVILPDSINWGGEYTYNGKFFTFGLFYQLKKISAGFTLQTPFTLMESSQFHIGTWMRDEDHNLSKRFKGAARWEIAYDFNGRIRFGIGYRYQDNIILQDNFTSEGVTHSFKRKYGASHNISLGGQYILTLKEIKMPVYLTYRLASAPSSETSDFMQYQNISVKKGANLFWSVAGGLNLHYNNYQINLATQLTSQKIYAITEIAPPYS